MSKNAFDIILETEETNNKGLFVDLYLKPIEVKKNADDSVMSTKEWILSGNSNLVNIPKTDLETASEEVLETQTPVKTTSENEPEKTKKETKTVTKTVTTCTSCKKYKRYLMYSFLFYILLFILFLTSKKQ